MVSNPWKGALSMKHYRDPLFAPEKRRHPALVFFLLLLVLVISVTLVFNHINNSRVNLLQERVTITNLPSSLEGYRILHISDLHGLFFGTNQERIAAALSSARYDAVCITGDVVSKTGNAKAFLRLLDLFEDVPVFFIPGDEDPDPIIALPHKGNSPKADYILKAEEKGVIYLDAPEKITVGKSTLWFCPEWVYSLDLEVSVAALENRRQELIKEDPSSQRDAALAAVEYQLDQMERIRSARREILVTDTHIALTHHPLQFSALENLNEWTASENESYVRSVSLVLAGHYVGGQWRIPGIGALRAPLSSGLGNQGGWFPEDEKVMGLSSFFGIPQYISPGLGTSAAIDLPGIRLFNTPSVSLLILTSKLTY